MANFGQNCILMNFEQDKTRKHSQITQLTRETTFPDHANVTNLLNMSPLPPVLLAGIPIDYGILSPWSWRQPLNFLTQHSRHWKELETTDELNAIDYYVYVLTIWMRKHTCQKWFWTENNKYLALLTHSKWTTDFTTSSGCSWDTR